jgi:hypothetical protein
MNYKKYPKQYSLSIVFYVFEFDTLGNPFMPSTLEGTVKLFEIRKMFF